MRVREIMSDFVIVASPGDPVSYLRDLMTHHQIHAVPILDDEDRPAGIVTSADLVEEHGHETTAGEIMTSDLFFLPPEADVRDAARMMRERHLHHLLVLRDGEVVGIVSSLDLLVLTVDPPEPETSTDTVAAGDR